MTDYRVTLRLDVEADAPGDAAREALAKMRRPNEFPSMRVHEQEANGAVCTVVLPHETTHPLRDMHRYLFPERYGAADLYEWDASTIEDVAYQLEEHMRAAGIDVPAGAECETWAG